MSVNRVDPSTGELSLIAGGTLYADAPVGTIQAYGGASSAIPQGWLYCNGAAVSRTTYAELFAVIGTSFGTGDGSTTFNIPDLRGEFLRGAGNNSHSGQGDGGTVGQHQDATEIPEVEGGYVNNNDQWIFNRFRSGTAGIVKNADKVLTATDVTSIGVATTRDDFNLSRSYAETIRPTNTSVNYIIKAKQSALPADITSAIDEATGRQLPLINLGTSYTAELKADISSGKFEKAVVGGYLTINGHVYYLAHPDYWLHTGDTECTTHHMLVVPAGNISAGKMNNTNITTGGYVGSDMKTGNNSNTALATAKAQIVADFGAANILTHRELFANAVTDGKASGWAWADSDIDLMNEVMVYGCNVWASAPGYETGIDKCQLKLFQERPDLITTRAPWWLRSVVSATVFALVSYDGIAYDNNASNALGVRPVFAIK